MLIVLEFGNPFEYFYNTKTKQSFVIELKQKETHAPLKKTKQLIFLFF